MEIRDSVGYAPRQTLLDPIDLSLLSGKKHEFMIRPPTVLTIPVHPD
jgi:hypothetical protein